MLLLFLLRYKPVIFVPSKGLIRSPRPNSSACPDIVWDYKGVSHNLKTWLWKISTTSSSLTHKRGHNPPVSTSCPHRLLGIPLFSMPRNVMAGRVGETELPGPWLEAQALAKRPGKDPHFHQCARTYPIMKQRQGAAGVSTGAGIRELCPHCNY